MGLRIFLLTIIWCLYICEAKRNFMRGRSRNGNLGDPILSKAYELPQEQWLHQKLDHSDPSDGRKWKQRYFVNDTFYQKNGPVFLMIGGEGEASPKWMVEGQWIEYAKQFGALCFQLEHRFYGKSHPTSDLSIKNLRFLTAEQALTDLAYFIEHMNELYKIPSGTKWIAFGGSYPGSLAAWMRVKYPNLIYGAVSSSGPLLAKIDFQEYYVVVEEALRQHSQACVNAVANASTQIDIMLKHPIGKIGLNKMFRLCDAIDPGSPKVVDIANLYETFASNLAGIVQYNKDNRNNSNMANFTVDTLCEVLVDQERGTALDRFADISNAILNATNEKCLDYNYEKMIRKLKDVDWKSEEAEGGRQWMYQTCTEFGFFQTSTARPTLFSKTFPVEFFIKQCEDVFGPRYNLEFLEEGVERTNIEYGALDIQVANVVFVHGSIDPWHTLGITKTSKPHTMAIYINGTAHCANMYPPSKNDLPQLKEARQKVGELLEQWLKH